MHHFEWPWLIPGDGRDGVDAPDFQNQVLWRLFHLAGQNHRIIQLLASLEDQETEVMSDLSAIQNAVAAEKTVEDGVVTLLNQLAADVAAAANDPAAIQGIVDNINANAAALSAAVVADTPAAPADPGTTPSPDDGTGVTTA